MENVLNYLIPFLNYLIPFATIALSYILGRVQEYHALKRSALKERYEAVYIPFVSAIYRSMLWENLDYSKMPFESRSVFFDILFKNIQYIDKQTQSLLPEYYTAYLNMLEFDDGNNEFSSAPQEYNRIFNLLLHSILSESSKLSRKLCLPLLGKDVEAKFFQSDNAQQQTSAQESSLN